jgi:hypothetical protein
VKKLETKGTLLDVHGGGRPEMAENTVNDIANRLLASPRKFLRKLSQEIGLSRSTCQRVAKKTSLRAYQFAVVQELKQQDYDKCMTYCRWFQTFIDENPGTLDYTWFSDEACFHLFNYMNSQNTRLWGSENLHALFEEPLYSQKVGVFCVLSQRRIIGSIFFNTSVTSQVYIELFREFFKTNIFWDYLRVGRTVYLKMGVSNSGFVDQ